MFKKIYTHILGIFVTADKPFLINFFLKMVQAVGNVKFSLHEGRT